jgi:hypothetical protein
MNFKQQKIVIRVNLYYLIPTNKNHFLEQLAKTIIKKMEKQYASASA